MIPERATGDGDRPITNNPRSSAAVPLHRPRCATILAGFTPATHRNPHLPMRAPGFLFAHRRVRRAALAWLLVPFLLLQVQAAIGGCLLAASGFAGVAAVDGGHAASAAVADHACCPDGMAASTACANNCEQSISSPSPAVDHAAGLAPFDSAAHSIDVHAPRAVPPVVGDSPRSASGPPAFLRFLRLLN